MKRNVATLHNTILPKKRRELDMTLLGELQELAQAEYISSLQNLNLQRELDTIIPEKYLLKKWVEAVHYLTHQKGPFFQNEQEARQFYRDWRK